MATVKRFEDLDAWKEARKLIREIYDCSKKSGFVKDFALRDQVRRAAISIMSNIAEGFERGADKEFVQFLSIAKGSCGEVRAQCFVALDQSYITRPQFESLYKQCRAVNQLLSGLIAYLTRSPMKGRRGTTKPNATESSP